MRLLLAAALSLVSFNAIAADGYPSDRITVVVPYPPGGVTDLIGRIVAEGLQEKLEATVVVENRPGASGIVGTTAYMNMEPDGHSVLIGGFGSHVLPPLIMSDYPFDVREDLTPIAMVAEFLNVMITNNENPANSVTEFIDYAKTKPGELNFASAGVGASNHLTAEFFMSEAGIEMVHVPYQGEGEAIADLRGGAIDVIFSNLPSASGHIEAGAVKPLGVTSSYRSERLPDVPTIAESGLPGFSVTSWVGVFGQSEMPAEIAIKLGEVIAEHVQVQDTQDQLRQINFEPVGLNSSQFVEFYYEELDRWGAVIEDANLRQ